jgi:hypothetical protein
MAGRGPQSFKKRQKEQARKERQEEKVARRLQRKQESRTTLYDEFGNPIEPEAESEATDNSEDSVLVEPGVTPEP